MTTSLDDNRLNFKLNNLVVGTVQDNVDDAKKNNRTTKGVKNGSAKLTEKQVRKIRKLYKKGKRNYELVIQFRMSKGQISSIVLGRTWKHLL